MIKINGFNFSYRCDRVIIIMATYNVYISLSLFSCRRREHKLPQLECIWVEVFLHNKKELLGTFYRPSSSHSLVNPSIEDSAGLAFDTNISKKLREKSRVCHIHKPRPFQDTKRKWKQTKPNKRKSNKRKKSTKISSLFPQRDKRMLKRLKNTRTK